MFLLTIMTEETNTPISPDNKEVIATITLLEKWIQKRIISFDKRRNFYRKGAYQFTLIAAGLSTITTILIGVGRIYNSTLISVISLVTSAAMSFLSAWEGFYGYRQRWVQNNDTLMKLYAINSDIQYQKARSGNNLSLEEIDQFYKQYQEILRTANEKWREDRTEEISR